MVIRGAPRLPIVLGLAAILLLALVVTGLTLLGSGPAASAPPSDTAVGSSPSPGPTATATAAPTQTPTPTPQPTPELAVDSLTGLLVSPAAARLPVIAMMVDDHRAARPQSGFNSAAIVWQAPAEGGIPRYMLVFHATVPGQVGPVRSAREYFLEWATEWHAMYGHAGGSPQAIQSLRAHGSGGWVWNADEFAWGKYYWRVQFNVAPHNLYTDGTHLEALATHLGVAPAPAAPVWTFAPDRPVEVRPIGGTITATYPYETVTFKYDWRTNTYRRYIDGSKTAQVDGADKAVVAPKNVVILRMAFGPLNDGHPNKHRLEAADVGHGTAWIATNGRTIKGTWRKASVTAPTLLYDPNGKPVVLTAGQTFVEVLTLTDGLKIQDGVVPQPRPLDAWGLNPA